MKSSGPRVTCEWDATMQEWFVNDRRGLEHGFTVRERPSADPVGAAGDYGLRRQAKRDAALGRAQLTEEFPAGTTPKAAEVSPSPLQKGTGQGGSVLSIPQSCQ